ncbi:MBL fold metallo-hydrolase [Alphaproteobacteria bacterium]|nr:MBL fold metallo-hydrolase [Alphaproteobacteria bacterium]
MRLLTAKNLLIRSLFFGVLLTGCSAVPDYSFSPNFNSKTGEFEHPDGVNHDKGFFEVLGLARKYFTRPADPAEKEGFPLLAQSDQSPRPEVGDSNASVTWVGHSTLLFERGGKRVLTDPIFSDRASPFTFAGPKRVVKPAITIAELPPIDAVIISHGHYDHLDLPGLKRLVAAQPDIEFIVPLGLAPLIKKTGSRHVTEIDWWQAHEVDGVRYTATPVRHWSSRSMFDRNETLWAGYMVRFADGYQFYFAGDTGYGPDFIRTRENLGAADFAAIPIGAYDPREFMKSAHVNPEEAVQIFQDIGAKKAVAVHWGTFKLTMEPMAEPPVRLNKALVDSGIGNDRFRALIHGERWDL